MYPLLSLCVFWLLPAASVLEDATPLDCVPRKTVPHDSECYCLSCITLAYSVSSHIGKHSNSRDRLIGKQGGCSMMNQSCSVRRGQGSPVSRERCFQLLHHVVERRPGSAAAGCQGGSVCSWPQRHLQETCLSKNTFCWLCGSGQFHLGARPVDC